MAKAKKKNNNHYSKAHILIGVFAVFACILVASFITQKTSAKNDEFSEKRENATKVTCNINGNPVINVEQKIINDADSGEAGNYWAFDTIERKIKVWKVSDGKYCATVYYEGKFAAVAGQRSPGNTGVLTGKEKGEFKGGYKAEITGSLLATPALRTKGNIGKTDYKCDLNGNCPGAFDWSTKYFNTSAAGFTFNMPWWGWTYRYKDKVWVNAITGNSGDVI